MRLPEFLFSGKTEDHDTDTKAPNILLFDIFVKRLKDENDREIFLSQGDCKNFLSHIQKRDRDIVNNPFPINFQSIHSPSCTDQSEGDRSARRQTSSDTMDTSSVRGHETLASSRTTLNVAMEGTERYPAWLCLVKAFSGSQLALTFIPASYEDILLLNLQDNPEIEDVVLAGGLGTTTADNSADSSVLQSTSEDAEKLDDNKADEAILNIVHDIAVHEQSAETETVQHALEQKCAVEATNEQSPIPNDSEDNTRVKQAEEISPKLQLNTSKTLSRHVIPVYIYYCYFSNVTTSLVNPWEFSLPEDIYEDQTFNFPPNSEDICRTPLSPRSKIVTADDEDEVVEDREDIGGDGARQHASLDRRSLDIMSESRSDFKMHCSLISEVYFSSFVNGKIVNILPICLNISSALSAVASHECIRSLCRALFVQLTDTVIHIWLVHAGFSLMTHTALCICTRYKWQMSMRLLR